ncbi:MAG TPA: Na+/H+ antiporter NhaA [Frankiaceae bacterium]|nr:Na+/H+ antiporter NhaA [Frankiaceae bacterium]
MTDEVVAESGAFSGRTAWTQSKVTPLRIFLSTESGSAAILLAGTLAALVWANADVNSYDKTWATILSVRLGGSGVTQDLRGWINSGLMTFFFFVVGLEARREFDLGELRERRRVVLPVSAGIGGMVVPIAIFLAINAGHASRHGWGVAMSTDTAFALGLLAIVGRQIPDRVRLFLLTVAVVDDLVALVVIAVAYSDHVSMRPLMFALLFFAAILVVRALRLRYGLLYGLLGIATWVALFHSGIDPVVVGLAMGLLTYAYAPNRDELERATGLFRLFREQPTPELAREARAGLEATLSFNDRLQQLYHPWTSYLIVPVFAVANAGIKIDGKFLSKAYTSPITLGIIVGYVLGKPIGVVGVAWLVTKLSRGRIALPVGWASTAGAGAIAGIGFTVSLLIASLAFHGDELREAKLGVLTAALAAAIVAWTVFRLTAMLPSDVRARALLGTAETIVDLATPVDPDHDHVRGPRESLITIVEYGDFQCPYCGQAEPIVREFLAGHADVRYVWRHLPLHDVHPQAQIAAEAAEAAANQGKFWELHDLLLTRQDHLKSPDLANYAAELGLDVERFKDELNRHVNASRVADDLDSASLSSVSGTPTFFINGRRHYGAYDIDSLTEAVKTAKARAFIAAGRAAPAVEPA